MQIFHYLCTRNEKIPNMSSEIIKHTAQQDCEHVSSQSFNTLLADVRQIIEQGLQQAYHSVNQAISIPIGMSENVLLRMSNMAIAERNMANNKSNI